MKWTIHTDGTFDLNADGPSLRGAYPRFDGRSLRPMSVEVQPADCGGSISYQLAEGRVKITLGAEGDRLTLASELELPGNTPVRFSPIGEARLAGWSAMFRHGYSMGDETKLMPLPADRGAVRSFAVSALKTEDGRTLSIAPLDHARFLHEADIYDTGHDGEVCLDATFKTELIPCGGVLSMPSLHFRMADTPWAALRGTAEDIGRFMKARTDKPQSYHWCSWYYLYQHLDEAQLAEYLEGFGKLPDDAKPQTVQIDAGYFPHSGDWLETSFRFPSGMKAAFGSIRSAGFRAGIWIGPFMVGSRSRLYAEHPDWLLRKTNGELVNKWVHYHENRPWGYQDEETCVLDTSHPDAMDYLRDVFRTFRSWGVEYFKTDFLEWGLNDSSTVQRHAPGKTSQEYLRDVFDMIREEIGEESYWLACIAPFSAPIGYVDGLRIAGDVAADWGACQNMLTQSIGCQYTNNVWYQSDPDAIILRRMHSHMRDVETESLALWMGMPGGIVNTSCPLHKLPPDRLALWKFMKPGTGKWTAELPYWGQEFPFHVMARRFEPLGSWAVLALNPQDESRLVRIPVVDVTGNLDAEVFEWGPAGARAKGRQSELLVELKGHGHALFYLGEGAPPDGLTLGGYTSA